MTNVSAEYVECVTAAQENAARLTVDASGIESADDLAGLGRLHSTVDEILAGDAARETVVFLASLAGLYVEKYARSQLISTSQALTQMVGAVRDGLREG